jgi:hypothetical protein
MVVESLAEALDELHPHPPTLEQQEQQQLQSGVEPMMTMQQL